MPIQWLYCSLSEDSLKRIYKSNSRVTVATGKTQLNMSHKYVQIVKKDNSILVETPFLQGFKKYGDVSLRNMVSGHGGMHLGLDIVIFRGLF